jgi:DNA-binding transcriptional MerR regulator
MAQKRKPDRKNQAPKLRFYSRSVVQDLCGVTEHELALWESEDLVGPARLLERGSRFEPLYDDAALRRIRLIRTLADDLEINIPGIGVILHLLEQMNR